MALSELMNTNWLRLYEIKKMKMIFLIAWVMSMENWSDCDFSKPWNLHFSSSHNAVQKLITNLFFYSSSLNLHEFSFLYFTMNMKKKNHWQIFQKILPLSLLLAIVISSVVKIRKKDDRKCSTDIANARHITCMCESVRHLF